MIVSKAPAAASGVTTLMHVGHDGLGHDGLGDVGLGSAARTFGYISAGVMVWAMLTGDRAVARKVAPWAIGGVMLGVVLD